MGKREEYISGPHHFWIHFWWGVVLGVVVSTWIGVSLFERAPMILGTAALGTIVIAYCCGRWGDSVWYWLIEHLPWIK